MMSGQFPILDLEVIDQLAKDVGVETMSMLLASLTEEIQSTQQALTQFFEEGNMVQLGIRAHALKSAARSFGAMQLGEMCALLEKEAGADGGPEHIKGWLDVFNNQAAATLAALDAFTMMSE